MPRTLRLTLTLLLATTAAILAGCGAAPHSRGAHKSADTLYEWRDVTGIARRPLDPSGRSATVLLFVAPDCPISNGYAPEIRRVVESYQGRGVGFFAVHADPRVSADAAREHATAFGYTFPVLLDPGQTLARHVGATVTPEAAVLDGRGNVAYLGRIDDVYAGFGKRRAAPTRHDLRDALDAVLAGRLAAPASEPPVGCEIPPAPSNTGNKNWATDGAQMNTDEGHISEGSS